MSNKDNKEFDNVKHPKHYNSDPSGVECITITKHRDFCVGNAIKYLWRCGLKNKPGASKIDILTKEIEDLGKAKVYIDYKIDMLNEKLVKLTKEKN